MITVSLLLRWFVSKQKAFGFLILTISEEHENLKSGKICLEFSLRKLTERIAKKCVPAKSVVLHLGFTILRRRREQVMWRRCRCRRGEDHRFLVLRRRRNVIRFTLFTRFLLVILLTSEPNMRR